MWFDYIYEGIVLTAPKNGCIEQIKRSITVKDYRLPLKMRIIYAPNTLYFRSVVHNK